MKSFLIGLVARIVCFTSCNNDTNDPKLASTEGETIDPLPGECPYLTKDAKGNTVLSLVRMLNDSNTAFCYAGLKNGKTFTDPVIIPGSNNIQPHGENLPNNEVIVAWDESVQVGNNYYKKSGFKRETKVKLYQKNNLLHRIH